MNIPLSFTVLISAPGFGTQGAYTAYHFCKAALAKGQHIQQIFFYSAGVYNANRFIAPAPDEINLMTLWQALAKEQALKLQVCIAAAQRRGIQDKTEKETQTSSLADYFIITGLGQLITAATNADRFITFN